MANAQSVDRLVSNSEIPFIARDDFVASVQDEVLAIFIASLLSNDDAVQNNSFELTNGSTSEGGALTLEPGYILYTPPTNFYGTDSFSYQVCSEIAPDDCQIADVYIDVNGRPVLVDASVWVVIGTSLVGYDIAPQFIDVDGDAFDVSSINITGTSGGVAIDLDDGAIIFTPDDPSIPAGNTVDYSACDNAEVPACDDARLTIWYNDPPTVADFIGQVRQGALIQVTTASIIESTEQNVIKGGVDLGSLGVSQTAGGPFISEDVSIVGNTCSIDQNGFKYVASSDFLGADFCYLQVCEELPTGEPRACGVGTYTLTIVGDDIFSNGFE